MKTRITISLEPEDEAEAGALSNIHKVWRDHFDNLKKDAQIPLNAEIVFVLKPQRKVT